MVIYSNYQFSGFSYIHTMVLDGLNKKVKLILSGDHEGKENNSSIGGGDQPT